MPRKINKTKAQNKATLDAWRNDLQDNSLFVTFFKWVQKNHPEVLAKYREAQVEIDPLDRASLTGNFFNAGSTLFRLEDEQSNNKRKGRETEITLSEVAECLSIEMKERDKTSIEHIAEVLSSENREITKKILQRLLRSNDINDWRIFKRSVLEGGEQFNET